jgi:hypothetical protein
MLKLAIKRFCIAASLGCFAAGTATGSGKIEKPPGVPPEVDAARVVCPTIEGPCHGYYATRWRVLPAGCSNPDLFLAPDDRLPPPSIPPGKAGLAPQQRMQEKSAAKTTPAVKMPKVIPPLEPYAKAPSYGPLIRTSDDK